MPLLRRIIAQTKPEVKPQFFRFFRIVVSNRQITHSWLLHLILLQKCYIFITIRKQAKIIFPVCVSIVIVYCPILFYFFLNCYQKSKKYRQITTQKCYLFGYFPRQNKQLFASFPCQFMDYFPVFRLKKCHIKPIFPASKSRFCSCFQPQIIVFFHNFSAQNDIK